MINFCCDRSLEGEELEVAFPVPLLPVLLFDRCRAERCDCTMSIRVMMPYCPDDGTDAVLGLKVSVERALLPQMLGLMNKRPFDNRSLTWSLVRVDDS